LFMAALYCFRTNLLLIRPNEQGRIVIGVGHPVPQASRRYFLMTKPGSGEGAAAMARRHSCFLAPVECMLSSPISGSPKRCYGSAIFQNVTQRPGPRGDRILRARARAGSRRRLGPYVTSCVVRLTTPGSSDRAILAEIDSIHLWGPIRPITPTRKSRGEEVSISRGGEWGSALRRAGRWGGGGVPR